LLFDLLALGRLLVRTNAILVPFGVAWLALGRSTVAYSVLR